MDAEPRLVIVRRGHFATFELLTRTFGDDPSVRIIWDRRIGERRRSTSPNLHHSDIKRGQTDRRRRPPTHWGQLHYMIAANEVVEGGATA